MKHPRIDDDKVVDRYLVGRLSSEDEAAFEEHLFECESCLEQVQAGEELRRGLRAVAAEDAARATVSLGLLAWLRGRGAQVAGLGLLVLLVVLPSLTVLWQKAELDRLQGLLQRAAGTGISEPTGALLVVSLGVVRDGAQAAEIRLDREKDAILLSLELQTIEASSYRVTLHDANDEVLWTGDGLEPNLYDTLLVALPSSYLAPGSYRIVVEGRVAASMAPAGEMELRVLKTSNSQR